MIGITPGFEPTAQMLCEQLAQSGPVPVGDFDDEWSPAGDTYRDELVSGGLVTVAPLEEGGEAMVVLTGAGVALAAGQPTPAAEPETQP